VRQGITLAPAGPLADPVRLVEVAQAAEAAGWDAVFLWDHVLRPEVNEIIDPWVAMAAMAVSTDRIRLGPMVTPLVRRRLIKLAREVLTLDLLSAGRLTLGLGLGVDSGGELSRFGDVVDARTRGAMLDEGADVLAGLLSGERVRHRGVHYLVDDVVLAPPSTQRPRPPIWCAARGEAQRPARRAARFEGLCPLEVDRERLARMLDTVAETRGDLDGFDVCVQVEPGHGPPSWLPAEVTWVLQGYPAVVEPAQLLQSIAAGPRG
jgi:alkanesulfonate monooxygenase SsuD/methylene tetrahydromethanopterin reductase-like flavin-dependent oxidoreductase (luciferase family)